MGFARVFAIIFGVFIIIGGGYCFVTPVQAFSTLSWLLGIVMVADGVANAVTWFQMRKEGTTTVWTLIGAIASVVLGVIILCNFFAKFAVDMILVYMLAAWLIVGGAMRLLLSLNMRTAYKEGDDRFKYWWLILIMGILILIVGVFSLFDPLGLMATVGIFMGISIVSMGIGVIGFALAVE